jgi:hypothetical protein
MVAETSIWQLHTKENSGDQGDAQKTLAWVLDKL